MNKQYQSLPYSQWNWKYHVVFVLKKRRKTIFDEIRKHFGPVFHELARQKWCQILEDHLIPAHVHVCISTPPKYSVASVPAYFSSNRAWWIINWIASCPYPWLLMHCPNLSVNLSGKET